MQLYNYFTTFPHFSFPHLNCAYCVLVDQVLLQPLSCDILNVSNCGCGHLSTLVWYKFSAPWFKFSQLPHGFRYWPNLFFLLLFNVCVSMHTWTCTFHLIELLLCEYVSSYSGLYIHHSNKYELICRHERSTRFTCSLGREKIINMIV